MKLRKIIYSLIFVAGLSCLTTPTADAQRYEHIPDSEEKIYGESAHVGVDYSAMQNIRRFWVQQVLSLKSVRANYDFALVSSDCVLKVTIPAENLFVPNDTLLSSQADGYLYPLLHYVRGNNALASVIVSCHSDNNGSKAYLDRLTKSRSLAIVHWMAKQGAKPDQLKCYGLATKSPLKDNSTMSNRAANRRVTIYLVPNKSMIKLAKKGTLNKG